MPTDRLGDAVRRFRRTALPRDDASLTDGQLLARFVEHRDEAAFASLVRRHGPMVWGVCRRVLRDHHDAEDAFQAAFLVLARKAASVVPGERVGGWLHGVARQTALRAGAAAARRRARERPMKTMPEPEPPLPGAWADVLPLLDQELSRLPDKYRVPVVLCDLEGKTRREAARQLGWPEGTVAGRLARGRALLARRLSGRGVPPAAVLSPAVPAKLLLSAAGAAALGGAVPASAAALAEGVLKAMQLTKLAASGALLLALAVVAGGSAVLAGQACRPGAPAPQPPKAVAAAGDATNRDGDGGRRLDEMKEDETAWGKAVGGLQAGIAFKDGRRAYRIGEVVSLVVRLRNVTDKELAFDYLDGFFAENPPTVADADGKPARLSTFATYLGDLRRLHLSLAAGQTVEFGSLQLTLAPADGKDDLGKPTLFAAPGLYRIRYENLPPFQGSDPAKVLSTGRLDLDVKEAAPPAKPGDGLEGSWQAVSFEQDGRTPRDVDVKKVVATFEGDKYHFTTGLRWKGLDKGALAVHPDADPRSFELTPDSGPLEGQPMHGIYKRDGDTLTLCFAWPTRERPTEFASPANSTVVLAVFERQKP